VRPNDVDVLETHDRFARRIARGRVLFKDRRYSLEYEVMPREQISAAGKKYDAPRIVPKIRKITDKKREPKVRQMTVSGAIGDLHRHQPSALCTPVGA